MSMRGISPNKWNLTLFNNLSMEVKYEMNHCLIILIASSYIYYNYRIKCRFKKRNMKENL